jgi:hypothetical protein
MGDVRTPSRCSLSRWQFVAVQAFAVGLLIGIGVQKAVAYDTAAPGAILLGVVTGAFGGAFADVLAGREPAIMRERHWLLGRSTRCSSTEELNETLSGAAILDGLRLECLDAYRRSISRLSTSVPPPLGVATSCPRTSS